MRCLVQSSARFVPRCRKGPFLDQVKIRGYHIEGDRPLEEGRPPPHSGRNLRQIRDRKFAEQLDQGDTSAAEIEAQGAAVDDVWELGMLDLSE